jgi:hypothetical protein
VILPKGHLSKILVRSQHYLLKHAGVETLITTLRDEYWIVGLRRLAKSVKSECYRCQVVDSRACNQFAAPLPSARVQQSSVFAVSGLDHAGPLFCLDFPRKKLYVLLFTCAVVRAVHLELVDSLTVSDTLLALRRFIARRGFPSILYSPLRRLRSSVSVYLGLRVLSGDIQLHVLHGMVDSGKDWFVR